MVVPLHQADAHVAAWKVPQGQPYLAAHRTLRVALCHGEQLTRPLSGGIEGFALVRPVHAPDFQERGFHGHLAEEGFHLGDEVGPPDVQVVAEEPCALEVAQVEDRIRGRAGDAIVAVKGDPVCLWAVSLDMAHLGRQVPSRHVGRPAQVLGCGGGLVDGHACCSLFVFAGSWNNSGWLAYLNSIQSKTVGCRWGKSNRRASRHALRVEGLGFAGADGSMVSVILYTSCFGKILAHRLVPSPAVASVFACEVHKQKVMVRLAGLLVALEE